MNNLAITTTSCNQGNPASQKNINFNNPVCE